MRLPSLLLALVAAACTPTAALAQSLTLTTLKTPIAKAAGKAPAKSIAELWTQINGLAAPAAGPISACVDGFDPVFYDQQDPGIKTVYGRDNLRAHYDQYGKWEGRLGCAGAKPWHPDASTPPADFARAPACAITVGDVWAPEGTTQVRVQFQLTRYGDGTPCERSYSIQGSAVNWGASSSKGLPAINLGEQNNNNFVAWEVLTLPSQGSRGELIVNIPPWRKTGGFHVDMRSQEYNPLIKVGFDILVGGERPKDARYYPDALVLPAPTPYPTNLGTPSYQTDFLGDIFADGWGPWDMGQLNGMVGAFTLPTTRTASGKLTDNYPIVTDAAGQRVRQLVMRDHRSDPVQGTALFSAPMISRLLGDGKLGLRHTIMSMPKALKGSDAALWGVVPGRWPPERDSHEGFAGEARIYQTDHMPDGFTTSFNPLIDVTGKHDWMEEFGRQTYRLWIDRKLVIERPNLLADHGIATTFSIEGPGGAGGSIDLTQPYDGMAIGLYKLEWWQR